MAQQSDPDEIQREIERTRAELAETIDAIADKVSPRRAVVRTADKVRAAVKGDTRPRLGVAVPETGERVEMVADNQPSHAPSTAADLHERNARATGLPGSSGSSVYTVERRLRVDRVLIVAGGVLVVTLAAVLIRRRGS